MQVLLNVQFLQLADYLFSEVILSCLYVFLWVLRKNFHETQFAKKALWKLVFIIVPVNPKQYVKEFFAVMGRFCEHTPHLVSYGLGLFEFRGFLDFYDVSESNHKMFLKIMKTRFLSFFHS